MTGANANDADLIGIYRLLLSEANDRIVMASARADSAERRLKAAEQEIAGMQSMATPGATPDQ